MKKYVKIQHPKRGTIPFELYPFQERALQDLIDNDYNIILKSRQLGITTLSSAYSLWLMIFHSDKNILCISITQETAKEIVTRVRFANDNLPSWLKVECVEDNRLSLRLKNGSQIKAVSSSGTAGRSSALSMLIIDEAAFIDNIDDIWTSAQSTLSTGGKAIVLSTPNGVGNFFHRTWIDADAKNNKFHTIKLPWSLHPERDQVWRNEQTKLLGPKMAAQECDCLWGKSEVRVRDKNTGVEYEISLENLYSQMS
jgi:phage FluMu gp28-like protein